MNTSRSRAEKSDVKQYLDATFNEFVLQEMGQCNYGLNLKILWLFFCAKSRHKAYHDKLGDAKKVVT